MRSIAANSANSTGSAGTRKISSFASPADCGASPSMPSDGAGTPSFAGSNMYMCVASSLVLRAFRTPVSLSAARSSAGFAPHGSAAYPSSPGFGRRSLSKETSPQRYIEFCSYAKCRISI